jgi:pectate lyase
MKAHRFILSVVFLTSFSSLAVVNGATNLSSFPGAEGFGAFAIGGRGDAVYHVTTLNDSGPGSFRDAVSRPRRTVVFDVAGIIHLAARVSVASNITIAGQTAPGDGIVIYGNGVSFSGANQAIVRYVRFRMGVNGDRGKDAVTIANGHDMIFDHVSVSWGRDENFSISGPVTNVTIQDSIIAQGLQPHSAGGLIQTAGGVSILRTLYIDNHTRNPKVKGANQFVNNVIYNWGGGGGYILGDSEGPSFANIVNNCFINGPSTKVAAFSRGNANFHVYAPGNVQDTDHNGALELKEIPRAAFGPVDWQEKPFGYPTVTIRSASDALKMVAANAGASLPRDEVDQQLVAELQSAGTLGETIARETDAPMKGPGAIRTGPTPEDTDRDGLPDRWELSHGLDPKNPDDGNHVAADGYTELEHYLNGLAAPDTTATNKAPAKVERD